MGAVTVSSAMLACVCILLLVSLGGTEAVPPLSSPAHSQWTFGFGDTDTRRATATSSVGSLVPGSPAPALTVPTLSGSYTWDPSSPSGVPMLAMVLQQEDAFSDCMWSTDSSLDDFILESPNSTSYLFLSYAPSDSVAKKNAQYMQGRLYSRLAAAGLSALDVQEWKSRTHFAVVPLQALDEGGLHGGWLPGLLEVWQSPLNQLQISSPVHAPQLVSRLDSQYAWLPWPTYANVSVTTVADPCSAWPASTKGMAVLVTYNAAAPVCPYFTIVQAAAAAGATTVVFAMAQGQPYINLNCNGTAQCNTALGVSASVIDYAAGQALQSAIAAAPPGTVNVSIVNNKTSGFYFGIDHRGQLVQVGWEKYPWMRILSWEAQWLEYTQELYTNLTKPALTVPIFGPTIMKGDPGVVVNVTLPPMAELIKYSNMELDMALGCPGTVDSQCPIWDHTVQLFVCCNGESTADDLCEQELGRWISPFRRRIGRWLTPVREFLPLIAPRPGQAAATCQFKMNTAPWAMPWKPSLQLRFTDPQPKPGPVPTGYLPLFRGGTFNQSYNNRSPISFSTPASAVQVKLAAVITGHGDDNNGCGEFCVTSHHFVVNGHPHVITFSEAGTPLGCANRVRTGVEPNEHGTWVYGRDGWCDGREVDPWVWDVTDELLPPGKGNNIIQYFGWFEGHTPDPTTAGAYIIMYSHLAFYTKP